MHLRTIILQIRKYLEPKEKKQHALKSEGLSQSGA